MECPYCKREMEIGRACSASALEWRRDNGELIGDKIRLCNMWERTDLESYYCPDCRRIILPVPEKLDSPMEKLKKKWNKLRGDAEEKYNDYKSAQEEEKYQKARDEKRKKDPWEV